MNAGAVGALAAVLLGLAVLVWPRRVSRRTIVVDLWCGDGAGREPGAGLRGGAAGGPGGGIDGGLSGGIPGGPRAGRGLAGDGFATGGDGAGPSVWQQDPVDLYQRWRLRRRPGALVDDVLDLLRGIGPALGAGLTPSRAIEPRGHLDARCGAGPSGPTGPSRTGPTGWRAREPALGRDLVTSASVDVRRDRGRRGPCLHRGRHRPARRRPARRERPGRADLAGLGRVGRAQRLAGAWRSSLLPGACPRPPALHSPPRSSVRSEGSSTREPVGAGSPSPWQVHAPPSPS